MRMSLRFKQGDGVTEAAMGREMAVGSTGARRLAVALLVLLASAVVVLGSVSQARAAFGFAPGSVSAETNKANAGGTILGPETQAGAVPFQATTSFELNSTTTPPSGGTANWVTLPDENVKDIQVDLPVGFVGDPNATPKCPRSAMTIAPSGADFCPHSTQVGTVKLTFGEKGGSPAEAGSTIGHQYPVYNMVPREGDLADFAFVVFAFGGTHVIGGVRANDHGVRTTISDISTAFPLIRTEMTLWGVPADQRHDADRGRMCFAISGFPVCSNLGGESSGAAPRAFLRNPSVCDGTQPRTEFKARSWQNRSVWQETFALSPPVTGCDKLTFTPAAEVKPDTSTPDAPTGLSVDLKLPQNDDPNGIGTPPMKKAVVTLPPGMSINPGGAAGLTACTDPALQLGSDDPVTCPESSKIGDVEATTPVLDETLKGGVYIRSQNSFDPESGEMFRIALVLENKERGLSIRLPGSIRVDKVTGQLVTTFDNNPQMPVDRVKLRFKSGSRAPLAMPQACGPHMISTELTSWAGQSVNLNSTFQVDCIPGMLGFAPGFTAGSAMPVAGAHSPFAVSIVKPDLQHALNGVRMELPEGLLANLKGRLGTQVGTVMAYSGPGATPYPMPGRVYLEGAYADAPFSLRVVVPAVAGPFNLGEVVVRQRIYVDRKDAHVTIVSDPLPTIVTGVPVRLQRLDVSVDAPGFMVNPTSCAPKTIHGLLSSAAGQNAHVTTRFQVGDCASKELDPKLEMTFTDKKELKKNKHPGVLANLGAVPGNANLKKVEVALPLAVALDPANAKELCPPEGPGRGICPADSIIGHAKATTPLLDVPVEGPVYFVKGTRTTESGRTVATLPKLYIRLAGQGVLMDLHADSSVTGPIGKQKLVTTFKELPDVALDDFTLKINGGANGVLKATSDICGANTNTKIEYTGHTNRVSKRAITADVEDCGPQIASTSHTSSHLAVRVGGIGAGTVTLTGKRIASGSRTIRRANAATVRGRLELTSSQQRLLKQGRTVKTSIRVRFKPKKGKTVNLRKTVSIKGVKRNDD
ncbi:MAG: hypothetical protein ITG02_07760 [Patulibacter sp.]|nr:hypothetical protein [Patulibacter sp.]